MKPFVTWLAVVALALFFGPASAVAPGQSVDYTGGALGKVVFDGKTHAGGGVKCPACHTKIFQMKKEAKITMADMNSGKNCGTCHNGDKAFKSGDEKNCVKCHKK